MTLETIKQMLVKSGVANESADAIAKALKEYKNTVNAELKKEWQSKLDHAKKLCLEETESHKRELAKRLQIFCEAKTNQIEREIRANLNLKEAKAVEDLKSIKNVLEGIDVDINNNKLVKTLKAELNQANITISKLNEDRAKTKELIDRQNKLIEDTLNSNKQLIESKQNKNSSQKPQLSESRQPSNQRRIDNNRVIKTASKTHRATVVENQSNSLDVATMRSSNQPFDVTSIANLIE